MQQDTPQSRRHRLLYLIGRSPTGNENVHYLSSEGIKPGTFRAAIQAGEVTKTGRLYSLTDAGRAATASDGAEWRKEHNGLRTAINASGV